MLNFALLAFTAAAALEPDPDFQCNACEDWNQPQAPYRVHGNTYYVGTAGLTALLITGRDENGNPAHVLIDGGLTQSAPLIDANIEALGFQTRDVQLILNSHEHFDHAGGMAALQRYSGAGVVVSEAALEAFHTGQVSAIDPQAGYAPENGFPPIPTATAIAGGETLELGGNRFTLNPTPGHAPGSTSWSWETCEDSSCLTVLYADSMSAVAAPGFQFSQALEGLHGATTADQLRDSISFLRRFDCDILLSPHPMYFGMEEKLEARASGATANPFHAPADCAHLADRLEKALDKRLEQEQAATP